MPIYRLEAVSRGYDGPTELPIGTRISTGGIHTESIQPGTQLPYKTRLLEFPHIFRGYVVDGTIFLASDKVVVTPEGIDPNSFNKLVSEHMRTSPGSAPPRPDQFKTLTIGHKYLREQRGAKIVMAYENTEYDCWLIPPPDPHPRRRFF